MLSPDIHACIEEVISQFLSCCSGHPSRIKLYTFGSVLRLDDHQPQDIDVLVLYKRGDLDLAHTVCNQMRELITYPPLDVLALSEDEERETDFISGAEATRIWPP
ncbi:nucleotidyltransferase domain-containing protein [Streptomyces lydicus]|uniref:nucleotidyltransferase domain-containing protein n=1 Tax=Streptomyces lydicus TaxID=47763 RepID=UPI00379F81D6